MYVYMSKGMAKDVRVQHSGPSLPQVVQDVEPGFDENPDPHVTLVLDPSLFAHVLAAVYARMCQHRGAGYQTTWLFIASTRLKQMNK